MKKDILNELIEKLIEDTKSNKIKWNKTKSDKYIIDRAKYYTEINEIGKISISKVREKEVYISISEKSEATDYNQSIKYDSDYYVNVMRLYNLIDDDYTDKLSSGRLEKAITAYINNNRTATIN